MWRKHEMRKNGFLKKKFFTPPPPPPPPYIGYRFPLSLSTIWGNHLHVKIPPLLFGETTSHLTSK